MAQNECLDCGEFHNNCSCPKCNSKLMAHDEYFFDDDSDEPEEIEGES